MQTGDKDSNELGDGRTAARFDWARGTWRCEGCPPEVRRGDGGVSGSNPVGTNRGYEVRFLIHF